MRSIAYQLEMQTHLVGFVDNRMAAYLGWIHTTIDIAEIWMREGGALTRGTGECDAVAVTIFAVADPKFSIQLIRKAKTLEPGRSVYWKRYFTTGKQPSSRAVRKKS